MKKEIWVPIDFNPKYEISSYGWVKGPKGIKTKGVVGSRGYMQITIERKTHNIHVLVAKAFIGDRPKGLYVCHNDGDKTNNNVENLRYDTSKANWNDFRLNPGSTTHAISRDICPNGHKLEKPNLMPSQLKRGWRSCLSCSRAHAIKRAQKEKNNQTHKELSDIYYERLLNGNR